MNKIQYLLIIGFTMLSLVSCGKKTNDRLSETVNNKDFSWHDDIQLADIPDFPVKGFVNGKEVNFEYINLERWRGSNDNVINFSIVKPAQKCGYISDFSGIVIINKGAEISKGTWLKSKFDDDPKSYQAYYYSGDKKFTSAWNCALSIESITEKNVNGKIAIFFNDETKSWIAGKFEAVICNN